MIHYERSYKTGRSVATVLEYFSWAMVGLGVLLVLMGLEGSSGGSGMLGGGGGAIAAVPGVMLAFFGLLGVMLVQGQRATMDTAEMTRDLLQIARGTAPESKAPAVTAPEAAPAKAVASAPSASAGRQTVGFRDGKSS